jgi:hypothetical protein
MATIVGLMSLLYYNQNRLIYPSEFPKDSRTQVPKPNEFGLEYTDLYIESKDKTRLHCYHIKGASDKVVLYFHANAGNMGHRIPIARELVNR